MSEAVVVKLRTPVQFGEEMIEELTLKPNSQAFRNFGLPMKEDGTIVFQPYALARVGVRMAGQPNAVLDKLDPADMWEVAQRVLGFTVPGLETGSAASP